MMELPVRVAGSIPQTMAQGLAQLPFGSQTQVSVGDGQLAAFLAYAGCDRKIGTAKYALRVLNNTPFAARARLFVEAAGVQLSAYPLTLDIAPFSLRDDIIPVRLDITGPYDRAIVIVESEDRNLTVEAPPPERPPRNWWKLTAIGAVPVFAVAATALCQPHILDVAAPQKALAGSELQVPYQISGLGTVEYDLQSRDGLQLSAGLNAQSGVLKLRIPQDGAGSPYTLHVRMRNALMKDERTSTIAAVMPAMPANSAAPKPANVPAAKPAQRPSPPPLPLIDNLSVSPSPVHAGNMLTITYAAHAQSGDVFLVDAEGTTWARGPISTDGTTQFSIPKSAAGKELRVVLHALNDRQQAERSVGVTVLPSEVVASAPAQAPASQPASSGTTAPVQPKVPMQGPDLRVSSQVVAAGDTVTVSLVGVRGDVRVTMMSQSGTTVAEGDAGEGGSLSLNAPNVTSPETFFITATLTKGVSQQTIMKRLVVTPR